MAAQTGMFDVFAECFDECKECELAGHCNNECEQEDITFFDPDLGRYVKKG